MRDYETIFILNSNKTDEEVDGIVKKYEQIVTASDGNIEKIEKWGSRKLAYPIKKETKGNFVLMKIKCEMKALSELERNFKLDENVLRYLVTKVV